MLQGDLLYDPKTDKSEVDQFGYVDLVDVFVHGSISSDVNMRDLQFNEIGDPGSILGKPKDVFEAHRMAAEISERAAGVSDSAKQSAAPPVQSGEAK